VPVSIEHTQGQKCQLVLNILKAKSASYLHKMVNKECHKLDVMTVLPEDSKNISIQIIIIIYKSSTKLT